MTVVCFIKTWTRRKKHKARRKFRPSRSEFKRDATTHRISNKRVARLLLYALGKRARCVSNRLAPKRNKRHTITFDATW
jgi:hypothetical protein